MGLRSRPIRLDINTIARGSDLMTKKMLVPFSLEKASPIGKSFVVPIHNGDNKVFVSLNSLKPVEFGAVVYVGR